MPSCRTIMPPAFIRWPPYTFTPRRCALLSRPFFVEPPVQGAGVRYCWASANLAFLRRQAVLLSRRLFLPKDELCSHSAALLCLSSRLGNARTLGCKRRRVHTLDHKRPQRAVPCAGHPPPFLCAHSTSAGATGLRTVAGRDACSLRPEKWQHPAPSCSPEKQLARDIAVPQPPSRTQASGEYAGCRLACGRGNPKTPHWLQIPGPHVAAQRHKLRGTWRLPKWPACMQLGLGMLLGDLVADFLLHKLLCQQVQRQKAP